ncbi:MAG: hypothetical protein N3D20_00425 [Candidatus Pacearchaeota archaeon]|nr:hypothetical protein [Candidatus Pacearchaeota archaeon]
MSVDRNLVGRREYVSPIYTANVSNGGGLDERDDFENWLRDEKNSLGKNLRGEYEFIGLDGIRCNIGIKILRGGENYKKIIKIRFMPNRGQIPEELEKQLEKRGYVLK